MESVVWVFLFHFAGALTGGVGWLFERFRKL